ncbi:MAG: tRNA pseudouridine(38-40) synthase TruA [Chloroflexota bacterium]
MTVYKITLAYDGTEFEGFQRLGPGRRTVQGTLEDALRRLGWQGRSIRAAGRTDAGVHARGQVVDFELQWKHDLGLLVTALNAHLPADVAAVEAGVAPAGFHPRFSASRRRYRYWLLCAPRRDPLQERFAWRVWPEPALEPMQQAAQALVGERDFGAFGAAPIPGGHTVRRVFVASWERLDASWAFDIEANAFLHHMVRRLVAALVDVGRGRKSPEDIEAALANPASPWEGKMAPARGLCLETVLYPNELQP